jgi:hypothetical protein
MRSLYTRSSLTSSRVLRLCRRKCTCLYPQKCSTRNLDQYALAATRVRTSHTHTHNTTSTHKSLNACAQALICTRALMPLALRMAANAWVCAGSRAPVWSRPAGPADCVHPEQRRKPSPLPAHGGRLLATRAGLSEGPRRSAPIVPSPFTVLIREHEYRVFSERFCTGGCLLPAVVAMLSAIEPCHAVLLDGRYNSLMAAESVTSYTGPFSEEGGEVPSELRATFPLPPIAEPSKVLFTVKPRPPLRTPPNADYEIRCGLRNPLQHHLTAVLPRMVRVCAAARNSAGDPFGSTCAQAALQLTAATRTDPTDVRVPGSALLLAPRAVWIADRHS